MRRDFSTQRGVALVLTLAFIVMLTIVAVGLMESMRIDRPAANSYLERARADQYAQDGVERVIATLGQYTADTNRNWISQPGQLIVGGSTNTGGVDERKVLQTAVPLSSGTPTVPPTDQALQAPNLNLPMLGGNGNYLITSSSAATKMMVKWIYVRKSGKTIAEESPLTTDTTDPIVGRYAYWTDDESSKINYNLAWGRSAANTNPLGHPTRIDLTALPGMTQSFADSIHNFITSNATYATLKNGFFNTPADARRVSNDVATVLENNKFDVTHYSHDPDTTFFNEPRILLTTKKTLAQKIGGTNARFLDIYSDTNNDALDRAALTGIDASKLTKTLNMLVGTYQDQQGQPHDGYLKRTDWPMVTGSGSSFQQKFYGGDTTRLTQIALNIIDYVRSKEAAATTANFGIVAPIRGEWPNGQVSGTFNLTGASGSNAFIGISRTPRITEIGMWVDQAAIATGSSAGRYAAIFKVEIYLPEHFGISSIDLTKLYLGFKDPGAAQYEHKILDPAVSSPDSVSINGVNVTAANAILKAGDYAVVTRKVYAATDASKEGLAAVTGHRPTTTAFRAYLYTPAGRFDLAPLVDGNAYYIPYTIDAAGTDISQITSVQVDDPRVNAHKDDWHQASHTFGGKNTGISTIGESPASGVSPQQDTDADKKITAASLYMPPPAGTPGNSSGLVDSVGELGYIHTGMESALKAGTPWRSLRLQPSEQDNSVVPDWALMDLFTVPIDVNANASYVYSPHGTGIGGRVNINSKTEPFEMQRVAPLAAVLQGCYKDSSSQLSGSDALTVAKNIYQRNLAVSGKNYSYPNAYCSPGEVVEIAGVADGGEASEELVRQISNLITARGNVFTVYSVGQAIRQTPKGKLIVTGEQRLQVMLERYLTATQPQEVHFAPIYYRNLTP